MSSSNSSKKRDTTNNKNSDQPLSQNSTNSAISHSTRSSNNPTIDADVINYGTHGKPKAGFKLVEQGDKLCSPNKNNPQQSVSSKNTQDNNNNTKFENLRYDSSEEEEDPQSGEPQCQPLPAPPPSPSAGESKEEMEDAADNMGGEELNISTDAVKECEKINDKIDQELEEISTLNASELLLTIVNQNKELLNRMNERDIRIDEAIERMENNSTASALAIKECNNAKNALIEEATNARSAVDLANEATEEAKEATRDTHTATADSKSVTAEARLLTGDLLADGRPRHEPLEAHAYMDATWASDLKSRRSFGGMCVRLAGGSVAYKAWLQATVALSSTESEFISASDTGKVLLYIRSILYDLGVPQDAATIAYEDNDACTAMANAQKPTSRTRHIDTRLHALCEWVERDLIKLERVDTARNMADHFTKQLTPTLFNRHVDYILGKIPPHYSDTYKNITELLTRVKPLTPKKKDLTKSSSITPLTSALPNIPETAAAAKVYTTLYDTWYNIISSV